MTITINQSTSTLEVVNSDVINKVYNLYKGNLHTISLSGTLYSSKGYKKQVDELVEAFSPNLIITVPEEGLYLIFEDPSLEPVLLAAGIASDGVGITEADAANAVLYQEDLASLLNTLTTFNEFNKFTASNGGGYNFIGRFKNFTNLTSINLTQLKYLNKEDFYNTGITVVNAPNLIGKGYLNGNSVFLECSDLITVLSLGNLSSIPSDCFKNCTSLTSVNLPSSVTEISGSAFENCTSLSLINLNNVTTTGKASFKNCSSLTGDLSLPNLTNLGHTSFLGCTGITSVSNLGFIQELRVDNGGYSWGAFNNCTNLTEMVFPVTLKLFSFGIFGDNCYVSKFIFPYGLTRTMNMPMHNLSKNIHYIQFPSTITTMDLVIMNYYTNLSQISMYIVIQATTPPTTGYSNNGNSFNSINYVGHPEYSRWYVPDANLNDYKTNSEWSSIASSIFPISLLLTDNSTWWAVYQDNKDYGVPNSQ